MYILGLESSCDETAASVVVNGSKILSSIVASQIDIHRIYGGVVPELASRKHLEAVVPVVEEALDCAGISAEKLDGMAVTQGPGLVGALLVGFCFAKGFAYGLDIPWIGVNHLEGHINSVFLEKDVPEFPFTALLVSGGHTSIYYVTGHTRFELMGQTRDDAAGEAFDKVSKMLGLGYPGGALIGRLAQNGDREKINFPRSFLDKTRFDFSFSGLKTSVSRYIQTNPVLSREQICDIAAGFEEAVVDVLCFKLLGAAQKKQCRHIAVVGGVAANKRLREKIVRQAENKGLQVFIPGTDLCGDNGAMIAAAGYYYLKSGLVSGMDSDVYSRVAL
ncbi:tRNA N6-adenosine threonylcarbamoyltransferase [Desulfonema limicola]|uniref:tRNA N6-adenosine threonylcarbamoyltransferase n=1 Tax=Desulfonema limicola TaxID=45656 RepID=A0A975GJD6_9BACT|nr:tRNA (adenosine(37)-N6)-threonylcarbamoyltransferase complex transferase subunit TsaD [Desulfonema limicola]QTA83340.1 tRNA N6-adenosine threonylcarbamoyltransferase [Desulfonema limicola]